MFVWNAERRSGELYIQLIKTSWSMKFWNQLYNTKLSLDIDAWNFNINLIIQRYWISIHENSKLTFLYEDIIGYGCRNFVINHIIQIYHWISIQEISKLTLYEDIIGYRSMKTRSLPSYTKIPYRAWYQCPNKTHIADWIYQKWKKNVSLPTGNFFSWDRIRIQSVMWINLIARRCH